MNPLLGCYHNLQGMCWPCLFLPLHRSRLLVRKGVFLTHFIVHSRLLWLKLLYVLKIGFEATFQFLFERRWMMWKNLSNMTRVNENLFIFIFICIVHFLM
ncbi:hypothetical protein ACSBR2_018092 [Camellia fascicularis]